MSRILSSLIVFTLILTACSSTRMTNTWKDSSYSAGYLNNVLVLCSESNSAATRTFEDTFVSRLQAMGIKATPGYQVVPQGQTLNEPQLTSLIQSQGYQYVLVSKVKSVETKTEQVAGAVYDPGMYNTYYGGGAGSAPFAPSSTIKFNIATLESKVYTVQNAKVIWVGQSKSFDPHASANYVNGVISTILDGLAKDNLIPTVKQ